MITEVESTDPNAAQRKSDHIDLAFNSQTSKQSLDERFSYEPMLSGHPTKLKPIQFINHNFAAPIWVSSMTGGTEKANLINKNLAKACKEFGLGMGLGSCRSLLESDDRLDDFYLRPLIGDQALYANLGIAQVEELIEKNQLFKIDELIHKLEADGLIIHVNPLQEWLQPEGDIIKNAPIDTISKVLDKLDISIIVKEVGQGMGKESLKALMQMPLTAIEFAAHGGTNFSKLEILRSECPKTKTYEKMAFVGHCAEYMVDIVNELNTELGDKALCKEFIISGGVKDFVDGYYLIEKCNSKAIYGQASSFLRHAQNDYEELRTFVQTQIEGLKLCHAFLKLNER